MRDRLFLLGRVCLFFWLLDTVNKIFFLHKPYLMIWYSSVGLLITGIGLIRRNSFLLTSMFCSLLLIESLWLISFFTALLVHHPITPIADYAFASNFPHFELFTTLYHILLVPSVIYALIKTKKVHPLGWLGAFVFAASVSLIASVISSVPDNVNCVFSPCEGLFAHLYHYPSPGKIFIGVIDLTFFVYLPLNALALKLQQLLGHRRTEQRSIRQDFVLTHPEV